MSQDSSLPEQFNTAAIRGLLLEAFSSEEFKYFCFDNFKKVFQKFTSGMSFDEMVHLLIEYCDRNELFSKLLPLVAEYNPSKYAKYDFDIFPANSHRLDIEWVVTNSLRETVGIGYKGSKSPSYPQVLALAEQLAPELFHPEKTLLRRKLESPEARRYRQIAAAELETEGKSITPLELVDKDIERYERLVQTETNRDLLIKTLGILHQTRQELISEANKAQLIFEDVFNVTRALPVSGKGEKYRHFRLPNERVLRIRMLHSSETERLTGADVLYENYWDSKSMVRLAAIRYEIWDNRTLILSETLKEQVNKLHQAFCSNQLCEAFSESKRKEAYRLPYCSAFLRPTDKLQRPDSQLISSGYHVPVCVINRLRENTLNGENTIASGDFRSEAVTYRIFEELFTTNMLGSRWLTYEELEKLYQEYKILDESERVIIHAQEFGSAKNPRFVSGSEEKREDPWEVPIDEIPF